MKAEVHLEIDLGGAEFGRAASRLGEIMPEGRFKDGRCEVRFRRGDAALNEVLALLDAEAVAYELREVRTFRPREITEALALHIEPAARVKATFDDALAGPAFTGGCETCGHGAEQVSDLVIDASQPALPRMAITAGGHIVVAEEIARAMIEERISGCLLRGTRDFMGRPADWFQILPLNMLPPLCVPPTRISQQKEGGCRGCGSGGLRLDSLLYYSVEEGALCDVNACVENASLSGGLAPGVVVSQRLFRILCDHEAQAATIEPIVLV